MALLPEQQLELAAREYCRLKGLNPDSQVRHDADPDENGCVVAVLLSSPRWMRVARAIREHDIMNEAIRLASQSLKGGE